MKNNRSNNLRNRIGVAVTAVLSVSLLFDQSMAWAASGTTTVGNGSSGSYSNTVSTKSLTVSSTMTNTDATNGRCIDSIFDWNTGSDHYDARIVRRCGAAGTSSKNSSWNDSWSGRTIFDDGVNKAAACTVVNSDSAGWGGSQGCTYSVNLEGNNAGNCSQTILHTSCFLRRKNGTTFYWNGGNAQQPSS
jgi:hypothetical protein